MSIYKTSSRIFRLVCIYLYYEKRFKLNKIKTESYYNVILNNSYIKTESFKEYIV